MYISYFLEDSYDIQNQLTPQAIAKVFEKLFEKEQPQLMLMGKQAIDDDSNGTGQILAGILDIPQVSVSLNCVVCAVIYFLGHFRF